jgi:predicted RecB family nuclease
VYLSAHGVPVPTEVSEMDELIKEEGKRHEAEHLASFPGCRDLSEGSQADRAQRTKDAVTGGSEVISQGVLRAAFPGSSDIVTGIPDLMIKEGDSYIIRDCKLSRSMTEGTHPETLRQLQTYGWLFETVFQKPPAALEAYLGTRTVERIPYGGQDAALRELTRLRQLSLLPVEPYSPVGWSKCSACAYFSRCWEAAEKSHDVSLVYKLDQAAALELRRQGVETYDELLRTYTVETLAALSRPHGVHMRRVGSVAERILQGAQALATGRVVRAAPLELPDTPVMVMFDLEGVPPQYEDQEKVYLWGLQAFRLGPGTPSPAGPYDPAVAGFGAEGDREGWESFLSKAEGIFARYGDAAFVHWASYEKSRLTSYIERHGDPHGVAARVKAACFDLLTAVQKAFALPLPSYGLKAVERLAGFTRTMEEYGGDWSIVQYLKASRSDDEALRRKVMETILRYNEEDLQATWAVLLWARAQGAGC